MGANAVERNLELSLTACQSSEDVRRALRGVIPEMQDHATTSEPPAAAERVAPDSGREGNTAVTPSAKLAMRAG